MSPTARSKHWLEEDGFEVAITEHWNQYAKVRQDLFGFADLLAIRPACILAVQATTAGNVAHRVTKILAEPRALKWTEAGGHILVLGWARRGKRWKANERWIIADDFMGS